jgi:hypothetical protein
VKVGADAGMIAAQPMQDLPADEPVVTRGCSTPCSASNRAVDMLSGVRVRSLKVERERPDRRAHASVLPRLLW